MRPMLILAAAALALATPGIAYQAGPHVLVAGPTVATIFVRLSMGQPLARSSRAATAGSFLPSTNSRKAPPPVEM